MKKKIPGLNFLHRHTKTEIDLNVDADHVIVDRDAWEQVVELLLENPKLLSGEPKQTSFMGPNEDMMLIEALKQGEDIKLSVSVRGFNFHEQIGLIEDVKLRLLEDNKKEQ